MATERQTGDTTGASERAVDAGTIEGPETNDHLVRVGGVSAILGAVIMPISLLTRPHTDPYAPIEETMRIYAQNTAAFDGHALGVGVASLLLLGGFVGLYESFRGDPGAAAWGRLGIVAAVVVTTILLFFTILDAPAMSRLAQAWADAPAGEKPAALSVAEGAYILNTVMIAPLHTGLFLTFLLFGVGTFRSDAHNRWLGYSGVALGLIGMVVGSLALRQGVPTEPAQMRDGIVLIGLFAWFTVVGVSMWRSTGSTTADDSPS